MANTVEQPETAAMRAFATVTVATCFNVIAVCSNRGDGEAPRFVADRPRLETERGVETVETMNVVGADVGDVQTPMPAAGGQVGSVA